MNPRPRLCLVTPALASANNGNWQTAARWGRWLAADYAVRVVQRWDGAPADAMIALHAGRSAASIAAWGGLQPRRPLLLVLTGTDLYRDILTDPAAQHSLDVADMLVVLNELGAQALPERLRDRCHVVLQSASARIQCSTCVPPPVATIRRGSRPASRPRSMWWRTTKPAASYAARKMWALS